MTFARGLTAAAILAAWAASSPATAQESSRENFSSKRFLEIPLRGPKRAELWVSADGGQNWSNHGDIDGTKKPLTFLAPKDGRYGFLVVPVGDDGRREKTPKAGDAPEWAVVVDSVAPVVELLAPNGGEMLGANHATVIQWAAADANLKPASISIEVSTGKDVWVPIAKDLPNSGKYHWDIPSISSPTCRVRISARDLAGNEGADVSDQDFAVDGLAPELRIVGPATANEVPVKIEYSGGDLGGSGLKRVTLWVTRDGGQTWKSQGDDEDLKSPYLFTDLDGVYGLKLVGEDRMGNAGAAPMAGMPPLSTLTLDRTKPEVKLLSPQGGGVLGGVPLEIQWIAKDNLDMPANGISLSWSEDGGKTWKDIAQGVKNDGLHLWTPPRTTLPDARVRISAVDFAGNVKEAVSERFGIDAMVPEARALKPDRSNSETLDIAYEYKGRGSLPIKSLTLYYKPEKAKEWIKFGEDPDRESPVSFAKADGVYGIYVVCATEAGLKSGFVQKAPEPDTEAQLVLTIDATPPKIELTSFNDGAFVMAGAAADITWKLIDPHPDPRGLSLYHSPDGGVAWNPIAANVDATKESYRWILPNVRGGRHKVRIVATDAFGNKAQVDSEKSFTIDNDSPSVAIVERPPQVQRSLRVSARYKASDPTSGIERVQVYARLLSDKAPYKVLGESRNAEGTMDAEIPGEGVWAFLLVATDGAGHVSAEIERKPKPDYVTLVDLTKPEIALKNFDLPQGGKTWINGNWEVEWAAKDALSPMDKLLVRIEHSSDAGRTWFVAVGRHPNGGKADLRPYLLQGKKYRIRLVAIDEAGNEAEDTSGDFDPGDVPPPGLTLRGIDDGRPYVVASAAMLSWSSPDRTVKEATLELSKDGGKTWALYAALATPTARVILPDTEGRWYFRVTARDLGNRVTSSNTISFDTIAGVDQVKLIANESVEAGRSVRAVVEPKAIVKSAKELRLEISENARDWTAVLDVKSPDFTFPAPATPGEYVLRLVVKTAEGREYDSNHFRLKIREKGSVSIRLLSFRGGQSYPGGTGRVIAIQSDAELASVKVELSETGGQEGSWKPLSGLQPTAAGYHWTLPKINAPSCRLRVSVIDAQGREQSDQSERDFAIESGDATPTPPVKAPPDESKGALRLVMPLPERVKGGTKVRLEWLAADPAAKVTVSLVVDGNSGVLYKDQPAAGGADWTVPRIEAQGATIVLTSGDKSWTSKPFDIVSRAPSIDGVDIEIPSKK